MGAGLGAAAGIAGNVVGITREALWPVSAQTVESARLPLGPADLGLGLRFCNNTVVPGRDEGHLAAEEEVGVNDQGSLPDGLDKGKERVEAMPLGMKADEVQLAPLLIATVVAPSHELSSEARRSAVRLERIGVGFQKTWMREREVGSEAKDEEEADG
jgi:hypothetical protein